MKTYFFSGDDGDTLYLLPSIRALGGGHVRLTPSAGLVRSAYTPAKAESIATLVRQQPYVASCEFSTPKERDEFLKEGTAINADGFRRQFVGDTIGDWIANYLGCQHSVDFSPWLTVTPTPVARVVLHRSPRYNNPTFPWDLILERYKGEIVMVGSEKEHQEFCYFYEPVPYHPTKDFLELAGVIAGCELFVGNQSAPMAAALGLGVAVIQEVCLWSENCVYQRENAQYVRDGRVQLL